MKLSLLAFVLAVLALAVGVFGSSGEPRAGERSTAQDTSHLQLEARLANLEDRIDELQTRIAAAPLVRPSPPEESRREPDERPAVDAALERRLAELEAWKAERVSRERANLERFLNKDRDEDDREQESVEEWTNHALDRNSSPEEVLVALRRLRGQTLPDGTDARLAALPEVIGLAETSQDGEVRADIWRQLDEVTDPRLRNALLHALANDAYPGAREEAAESLGPFLPDPGVETALRHAMEYDEDADVRRQAAQALHGRR